MHLPHDEPFPKYFHPIVSSSPRISLVSEFIANPMFVTSLLGLVFCIFFKYLDPIYCFHLLFIFLLLFQHHATTPILVYCWPIPVTYLAYSSRAKAISMNKYLEYFFLLESWLPWQVDYEESRMILVLAVIQIPWAFLKNLLLGMQKLWFCQCCSTMLLFKVFLPFLNNCTWYLHNLLDSVSLHSTNPASFTYASFFMSFTSASQYFTFPLENYWLI